MKAMKLAGNLAIAVALIALIGAGFSSEYELSDKTLDQFFSQVSQDHREALSQELAKFSGQTFSAKHALFEVFKESVSKANLRLTEAAVEPIWPGQYYYKEYQSNLTKAALGGFFTKGKPVYALVFFLALLLAAICLIWPLFSEKEGYTNRPVFKQSLTFRGIWAWVLGFALILFYVAVYFHPYYFAEIIALADYPAGWLGRPSADRWFFYGLLYTLAVLIMGIRMAAIHRNNRHQLLRTGSVVFFQLGFAFLLPEIFRLLQLPAYDLKNIWPLDYSFFYDYRLAEYKSSTVGLFLLFFGIANIFITVPLLTWFFGKRWYCSWVCGCGGLAETAGDPFRHLSDKSLFAWQVERYMVHGVLVLAVVMTALVLAEFFWQKELISFLPAWKVREWYGLFIGSIFAGVVGTGFYPLMGNRVWCRFGCPLAAVLGIIQRFGSRFRISVNGGQCISCGLCSTYCEMGIDVRWYAQRGQNIVRASCVGCGVCESVCPRGVLKLENGPAKNGRIETTPIFISREVVSDL